MARQLRIQYEGALYHITCRDNEQRDIFRDDDDRGEFLSILEKSLTIYSVKLFAYVLMTNHFHLLVETLLGNLSEFMRHFNITYTGHFNRRHRRVGHLYQGRYKSILVDKDVYLSVLSRYIHLNPVRVSATAKRPMDERRRYLSTYRWSSLPGYLDRNKRTDFVDYSMVLAEYGGDTDQARIEYRKQLYSDLSDGIDVRGHGWINYRRKRALRHMGSGDVSQGEEPEGTTLHSVDTPPMVKGRDSLSSTEGNRQEC